MKRLDNRIGVQSERSRSCSWTDLRSSIYQVAGWILGGGGANKRLVNSSGVGGGTGGRREETGLVGQQQIRNNYV